MIKVIFIVSVFGLLAACSGGGSESQSSNETTKNKEAYDPQDFVLNQVTALKSYGESKVLLQLNNLPSDDAIYVTVSSDQLDNQKIKVSPYKTVLNPNKGAVDLTLNISDKGSVTAPQIKVLVTTSGNTSIEQTLNLEWQAQ